MVSKLKSLARCLQQHPDVLRALLDVYARVYVEEVLHGKVVDASAITRHTREARKLREQVQGRGFIGTLFSRSDQNFTSLIEQAEQIAAEKEVAEEEYNTLVL